MIQRAVKHAGDESLSRWVRAGDYTFLAHHGGKIHPTFKAQLESCLEHLDETLSLFDGQREQIVQMNLYLKHISDLREAETILLSYFLVTPPVRTTIETNFFETEMLCQIDGIVYTPQ